MLPKVQSLRYCLQLSHIQKHVPYFKHLEQVASLSRAAIRFETDRENQAYVPLKVANEVALHVLKDAVKNVNEGFGVGRLSDVRNEHFAQIFGLAVVVLCHLS